MHRSLALTLATAATLLLAGPASAADLSVRLDGRVLPERPAMVDGRVMVPLRAIFEGLGAKVRFDAPTRTIEANGRGHVVVLRLDDPQASVDGKPVRLEAPARSMGGRTMVPLRFVAEAFGAEVRWDGAARQVAISATPQFQFQPVGDFDARFALKRLAVGNQASVLKVFDEQRSQVVFYKGLDDRLQARLSPTDRAGIRQALGIPEGRNAEVADQLMEGYDQLPRREAVAMLGVLGARSDFAADPEALGRIRTFLVERMHGDREVGVRRQATLALALLDSVDAVTVAEVLRFYAGRDNLWETFPVQQFFEYHAEEIKRMPGLQDVVQQVSAVPSLYTPNILQYLE